MLFTFLNSKHQFPFPISCNYCYIGIVSSHPIQLHSPLGCCSCQTWHNRRVGSGQVQIGSIGLQVKRVASQKRVTLSGLKTGSSQSGCGLSQVDLYLSHDFFFFFFKENNIYLPFRKSCNKLLDVKCITLNSPLISRINSVKLINTYSIILKLYKS